MYPEVQMPNSLMGLPLEEVTLPELLTQEGYSTGMVGKWHLGVGEDGKYLPTKQGYERYFGIPYTYNIKIIDVFSACRFKSQEQLEALVHRHEEEADFRLEEGSYLRLRRAIKLVTGMSERFEGVQLSFSMTIPALDQKPLKYSSSSL